MNSNFTVSQEMLGLSETIHEALEHLNYRLSEGHFEDTYYLFQDILQAFIAVYSAVDVLSCKLGENNLSQLMNKINSSLEEIHQAYKDNKINEAKRDMQFVLLPVYNKWMQEMDRCLRPLVES